MEQEDKGNDETPKATREKIHIPLQRNISVTAEFSTTAREAIKQHRSIFRGERKGSHQSRAAYSVKNSIQEQEWNKQIYQQQKMKAFCKYL